MANLCKSTSRPLPLGRTSGLIGLPSAYGQPKIYHCVMLPVNVSLSYCEMTLAGDTKSHHLTIKHQSTLRGHTWLTLEVTGRMSLISCSHLLILSDAANITEELCNPHDRECEAHRGSVLLVHFPVYRPLADSINTALKFDSNSSLILT